ncbi:hypothetical protein [Polyangium sp. 15x6]|uniref:hypothetical protein n=1 Tax=Polyangium sp. 15x6 TaxID=3042687 RepID=UPI00249AFA3F|nr:hypothetical protein [Polyangium sp. 15x6]MDI3286674.1 hypothetical protein [Polyangium sp. 15x6]
MASVSDKSIYVAASSDGSDWGGSALIFEHWETPLPPALTAFQGRLFMALIGLTGPIYMTSSGNGASWTDPTSLFDSWQTKQAPALAVHGDQLYLGLVGLAGGIYIATSSDGTRFSEPRRLFGDWETSRGLTLASFNGKLYMAFLGKSGQVYLSSSTDGLNWDPPAMPFGTWVSPARIGLAAFKEKLYMGLVGESRHMYLASSEDGEHWSAPEPFMSSWQTYEALNLAAVGDVLQVTLVGIELGVYVVTSQDGSKFSSPQALFGDWKVGQPVSVTDISLPDPTADQIKKTQSNLSNMVRFNRDLETPGALKITNAFTLVSIKDNSDPGLNLVVELFIRTFEAVAGELGPVGAIGGAVIGGLVRYWLADPPQDLRAQFADYITRFDKTTRAVSLQLATYHDDVKKYWHAPFYFDGGLHSLSDLATIDFPQPATRDYQLLQDAAVLELDRSVWRQVLVANDVVTQWITNSPIIIGEDPDHPPVEWAQEVIKRNPAYNITWTWSDGDCCGSYKGWVITEYNVGRGAGPFDDGSLSAAACHYLFKDSTPGTIINSDAIYERNTVFFKLGLEQKAAPVGAAPRGEVKLSVAYLRAAKKGQTLARLIEAEGRQAVERRIIEKAQSDSIFAAELRIRPRQALEEFLGVKIPETIQLSILVESGPVFGLVIPRQLPQKAKA